MDDGVVSRDERFDPVAVTDVCLHALHIWMLVGEVLSVVAGRVATVVGVFKYLDPGQIIERGDIDATVIVKRCRVTADESCTSRD